MHRPYPEKPRAAMHAGRWESQAQINVRAALFPPLPSHHTTTSLFSLRPECLFPCPSPPFRVLARRSSLPATNSTTPGASPPLS